MVNIGRPGKSRKPKDKNVLITRSLNNSRNSRRSHGSRRSNSSRRSNGSGNSIWSKNNGTKKLRSPKRIIIMAIILIAFICGLALGVSMIMGMGDSENSDDGDVQYMNVTKNITQYENSSYDLQDENGTQISYYEFDENVSEGQNITAFNVSNSANIY